MIFFCSCTHQSMQSRCLLIANAFSMSKTTAHVATTTKQLYGFHTIQRKIEQSLVCFCLFRAVYVNIVARHIVRFYNASKNGCIMDFIRSSQTKFAYGTNQHMPLSITPFLNIISNWCSTVWSSHWFVCGKLSKPILLCCCFAALCCSTVRHICFAIDAMRMHFFRIHMNGQICYYNLHPLYYQVDGFFLLNWLRCLCVFSHSMIQFLMTL